MATLNVGVVGLSGDFGDVIGLEGIGCGGAAWWQGFGAELRGGVVAYEDTGFVLLGVNTLLVFVDITIMICH